jgi:hypothetical protein
MSRPIQGDDGKHAGLRFAKWTWTLSLSTVQLYVAVSSWQKRETVGGQLAVGCIG